MQADDPLHQRLGPRRAAGHVDVDGDDLVDALEDRVVVEHPAGARARAHRDHPLRLEHLVVDLAQRRRHLVRDAPGDDQQVGLARRGAERLHPEARDVVARRDDRHHLDRAAGEPEGVRPHRLRLRPGDRLLERRQAERVLELSTSSSKTPGPFVGQSRRSDWRPGRAAASSGAWSTDLSSATRARPSARCRRRRRRGSRRRRGTPRTPNQASCSSTTASGYRKTISMSKRMKSIAVR